MKNKSKKNESRISNENLIQIGNNIQKIRKEKEMTQDEVAQKLECSNNAISLLEKGKTTLGVSRLVELCEVFNVDVLDIFRGTKLTNINEKDDIIYMYSKLNLANKTILKGILKVLLESQNELLIEEDRKQENFTKNKEILDKYNNLNNDKRLQMHMCRKEDLEMFDIENDDIAIC